MEIPEDPIHLSIRDARFIKYEQFMRLKQQEIVLRWSVLTIQEINRFLKSWMLCESHFILKSLKLIVSGPETIDLMMSLPHEVTTDPNILEQFRGFVYRPFTRGFNIRRSDGRMATVSAVKSCNKWYICFFVH
uniref:FBA_2 domain-containing protein n=1 Tax=Caenorhabditis tropicalis TaxID=1561998 RepID=A0A1I7TH97_9PELO